MKFSFASKARENIQAAELLLENKWYNASVNRSYYAAFNAALAVLASVDALEEKITRKFTGEI